MSQSCRIFGYLSDVTSGEALIGASVYAPALGRGAITNDQGYYSLALECGASYQIVFQMLGYQTDTLELTLSTNTEYNKQLSVQNLREVIVQADAMPTRIGQINEKIEKLKTVPALLGEVDIMKALTIHPGISAGIEGTVGLSVRGGDIDQNLLLLDGSTIYNNGHVFGFVSVFNPASIKQVDVFKGYFPAAYGGRLSSIIDVRMNDGNKQRIKKEASLGLINSSMTIDGPLKNNQGTFLISGRMAHSALLSLASLPAYTDGNPLLFAGMYDFNAKINLSVTRDGYLSMSFYTGDDLWGSKVKDEQTTGATTLLNWGNRTASLRYFKPLGSSVYSETRLNFNTYLSNYKVNEFLGGQEVKNQFQNRSRITEWTFGQQFQYALSQHQLKVGLRLKRHLYEPVRINISPNQHEQVSPRNKFEPWSGALYLEDNWQLHSRFRIDASLHYSAYYLPAEEYSQQQLEPRIAFNYLPSGHGQQWSISYGRMQQYLHLVSLIGGGLPYDIWLPATRGLPPQTADIISLGYQRKGLAYSLSLETFYKQMHRLVDLPTGNTLVLDPDSNDAWEEQIVTGGEGTAYGFEINIEKRSGALTGNLAYTYSRSTRRFASINDGSAYPFNFDRPHDVSLVSSYRFNPKWSLTTQFVLQSGRPTSIPEAIGRDFFGEIDFIYQNRNNSRLPTYHRLDVMLEKRFKTRKKERDAKLRFGIYNVYARPNALYVDIGGEFIGQFPDFDALKVDYQVGTFFRFIPAINYTVNW